jgi:hypothetical protein
MTTRVRIEPAGHPVQVSELDLLEDGSWRVAYRYILIPGQDISTYFWYATTTRRVEVIDLDPETLNQAPVLPPREPLQETLDL